MKEALDPKTSEPVNPLKSARDVASQMTALLNQDFDFKNPGPNTVDTVTEGSCVVVVGSTGTGKSSTIGKVTRRSVSAGNGKDRVTVR